MVQIPKTLIFLGPQGSGKGTQARLLAEKFGYRIVETGVALRKIAKEDSKLGRKVKKTIDAGNLVEPELAAEVVNNQLKKLTNKRVIVDGYPRNLEQYELLRKTWPKLDREDYRAVYIYISDDETIKRLSKRAGIENREDDTPKAIRQRLAHFYNQTMPVLDKIKEQNRFTHIDGMQTVSEVHQEILEKLNLLEND